MGDQEGAVIPSPVQNHSCRRKHNFSVSARLWFICGPERLWFNHHWVRGLGVQRVFGISQGHPWRLADCSDYGAVVTASLRGTVMLPTFGRITTQWRNTPN